MYNWVFVLPVFVLLVLSMGIASAETLVFGAVYDTEFGVPVTGANVIVSCSLSSVKYLTSSLGDGAYTVQFNDSECSTGDVISAEAEFGNLIGNSVGNVMPCDGDGCDIDFSIVNLIITAPATTGDDSGSGGGGSSSHNTCEENWECGEWSECKGGVQARSCKDLNQCDTTEFKLPTWQSCNMEEPLGFDELSNDLNVAEGQDGAQGFSRITGAVVGTLGTKGISLVVVFLVALVGFTFFVKSKKKANVVPSKAK